MTPDIDLDALTALEKCLDPAPWRVMHDEGHLSAVWTTPGVCISDLSPAEAEFFVAARNNWSALLSALTATRAELKKVTAERDEADRLGEKLTLTIRAFPHADNAANIAHARAQRDAARAELDEAKGEEERYRQEARDSARTAGTALRERNEARAERDHLRRVLDAANATTQAAQRIVTAGLAGGTVTIAPAAAPQPGTKVARCRCLHYLQKDGRVTLIEDLCCPFHGVDAKPAPADDETSAPHTFPGVTHKMFDVQHPAHAGQTCGEYESAHDGCTCPNEVEYGPDCPFHAAAGARDGEQDTATCEPCCSAHNIDDLCSFARFKRNACCGQCPDWNAASVQGATATERAA